MVIANILSEEKIDIGPEFNWANNLNSYDSNLPTLCIGREFCSILIEQIDVMHRKVNNKLFWTYTKKESRNHFHNDLEDFIQHAYMELVTPIPYIYFDFIQFTATKNRKILQRLFTLDNITSYHHLDDIIYIYGGNLLFGIDLKLLKYISIDKNRVKEKIKARSAVFLEGNEVLIEYINHMERLDNQPKYIPFLHSIINHE